MTVKNFTHSTQRLYIVLLLGEQWRDRCSGEQKTLSLGQTAVRACLDNFQNFLARLPTSGLALPYNSQNELLCVSFYLHTVKFTLFGVHFYTLW